MRSLIYARNNPYKHMLWMAMGGSFIIFFFISMVFLARKNGVDWKPLPLPTAFWFSTCLMVGSSMAIFIANRAFQQEQYKVYKNWMLFSLLAAIGFLSLQIVAAYLLYFSGNWVQDQIFSAFLVLMAGLHFLHIVLGIAGMLIVIGDIWKKDNSIDGFILSLNPAKRTRIQLLHQYWHFVDLLWIYLFIFFYFNQF